MKQAFQTSMTRFHSLPKSIKLLFGFLLVAVLGISQSKSADAQSGCPCGCGGTGQCLLGGASAIQAPSEIDLRVDNRWTFTATDGSLGGITASQGNAATLTWGIADDGSNIFNDGNFEDSSLVSFLDGIRDSGSTGGNDLTQRNWFSLFEQSANRISELSGVTFNFEASDDGRTFGAFNSGGVLGTRADIRIGGRSIDGQTGANTLAFASFPNTGETVFDTDNTSFFSQTGNNSVAFRNVLTHELFHALGIAHVESNNAGFLLEPSINTSFDGPQLDDILTLQRNYGDALEGTNNQAGNDTLNNATLLGQLLPGGSLSAGQEVDNTAISIDEVGFLSIDDDQDADFFEFNLSSLSDITFDLTPEGATYNQSVEGAATQSAFDSRALNDLGLRIFDQLGTQVATLNQFGIGASESLSQTFSAGNYFVEVFGSNDDIQLYTLDISAAVVTDPAAVPEPNSTVLMLGLFSLCQLRRRRR